MKQGSGVCRQLLLVPEPPALHGGQAEDHRVGFSRPLFKPPGLSKATQVVKMEHLSSPADPQRSPTVSIILGQEAAAYPTPPGKSCLSLQEETRLYADTFIGTDGDCLETVSTKKFPRVSPSLTCGYPLGHRPP
jgi:hypothetical protein